MIGGLLKSFSRLLYPAAAVAVNLSAASTVLAVGYEEEYQGKRSTHPEPSPHKGIVRKHIRTDGFGSTNQHQHQQQQQQQQPVPSAGSDQIHTSAEVAELSARMAKQMASIEQNMASLEKNKARYNLLVHQQQQAGLAGSSTVPFGVGPSSFASPHSKTAAAAAAAVAAAATAVSTGNGGAAGSVGYGGASSSGVLLPTFMQPVQQHQQAGLGADRSTEVGLQPESRAGQHAAAAKQQSVHARQLPRIGLLPDVVVLKPVFDKEEHWAWLLTRNVLESAIADLPEAAPGNIIKHGIRNPLKLAEMSTEDLFKMLECDWLVAEAVQERAASYASVYTQEELFRKPLGSLHISLNARTSSQQDNVTNLKLKYHEWNIKPELDQFRGSLEHPAQVFPAISEVPDKLAQGKTTVDDAYFHTLLPTINRLLRYDAFQAGDEYGYKLQQHLRGTPTDSTMKAIQSISDPEEQQRAADSAKQQAGIKGVPDWSLAMTEGPNRRPALVGDSKRMERLAIVLRDGEQAPPYAAKVPVKVHNAAGQYLYMVDAPDILYLLKHAGEESEGKTQKELRENAEGAIKQVAQYCFEFNVTLGFIGNFYHTWPIKLVGNDVYIGPPLSSTARDYSTVLGMYRICSLAIKDAKDRETAAAGNRISKDTSGNTGGSRQGDPPSDDAPSGGNNNEPDDASDRKPCRSQRLQKQGNKEQPAVETADASGAQDQQPAQQQQQQQPKQPVSISDLGAAAVAASQIDLDLVQRRLGHGWTGFTFAYQMSDGAAAALKVAKPRSEQANALHHEASVLLSLKPEWGKWVAPLLAAGTGKDGHSCVLAVERMQGCSHLDPSRDSDTLPDLQQALQAVHSHGVAHTDLRPENILVQKLAACSKKVWLIDWGFAALHATQEQQDADWKALQHMFSDS